jgi:hypothetical protein
MEFIKGILPPANILYEVLILPSNKYLVLVSFLFPSCTYVYLYVHTTALLLDYGQSSIFLPCHFSGETNEQLFFFVPDDRDPSLLMQYISSVVPASLIL